MKSCPLPFESWRKVLYRAVSLETLLVSYDLLSGFGWTFSVFLYDHWTALTLALALTIKYQPGSEQLSPSYGPHVCTYKRWYSL